VVVLGTGWHGVAHSVEKFMVKVNFSADLFCKVQNNVAYFVIITNTSVEISSKCFCEYVIYPLIFGI
jgi:hypothetical protein